MTFNSKNLHYEKQEPAFLRRLRDQNPTNDRHNFAVARPRKPRLETADGDEDGPTIVDESGESITQQEYKDLVDGKIKEDDTKPDKTDTPSVTAKDKPSVIQSSRIATGESVKAKRGVDGVAGMQGPNKRKRVKAIAIGHGEDLSKKNDESNNREDGLTKSRSKSNKKKIQLSFDDSTA